MMKKLSKLTRTTTRSNNLHWFPLLIVTLLSLSLLLQAGCGKLKGDFAFKQADSDVYKRIDGTPEFRRSDAIDWVFQFQKVTSERQVSVVLLKKEIVWVEISAGIEKINKIKKSVYGTVEQFDEGTYKIVIAERGSIIDEKEFKVFTEDDENEEQQ